MRTEVNRILTTIAVCASAAALAAPVLAADMTLMRLDCGTPQAPTPVNQRFSDTYAYGDLKLQFVYSCYLVKHGDDYLLWDTGHAMTAPNVAPKVSIVDQIAKLNPTRSDQLCRHQPLSCRSHRPGCVVSQGVAADRQGRLGSDRESRAARGRELQAIRGLDQSRRSTALLCLLLVRK
jgi:hypothetical protein